MRGVILAASFFASWYSRNFGGSKLNCLSGCCLAVWGFPDEALGIDPILTKQMFKFPILDGLVSILRPK